mgnify:CR=1 FL=1
MKNLLFTICITVSFVFGEDVLWNYDNRFEAPSTFTSEYYKFQDSLKIEQDTLTNKSYPARALLRSLVVPGWGQLYNKSSWWKTAFFVGIEVAGIAGIVQLNKKAENLRKEFEIFANEHWDFSRWIRNTPVNVDPWYSDYNQIPLVFFDSDNYQQGDTTLFDVIIDGTHQLDILYNGQIKSSACFNDDNTNNNCTDFVDYKDNNYLLLDQMQVIKDLHFYENIGKYDQFVGGWDDLVDATNDSSIWWIKEKTTEDGYEILIMTRNKEKYLDMRYDSNTYLKMATYAVSALMFNHVISGLEAVWDSQSKARKQKSVDTSLGLYYNKNSKYGIGGLTVAVNW